MPLHLLVKWEVVSPNREGQLASISIISSIPLFWFCLSNVGVVWGGLGWGEGVMFFSHFMLFCYIFRKKYLGIQNNYFSFNGGGGGGGCGFFLDKTILSDFTCYAIFNIKKIYWKVPLHLLVKWEVVSPNSREGQLASISIISSIPLFWFCISNVGVVWGGGCNVFLTFYAIFNIFRKKYLGIQNNYFSFNVLYAGNIVKCPFTYSYWLNGRWFL